MCCVYRCSAFALVKEMLELVEEEPRHEVARRAVGGADLNKREVKRQ